MRTLLVAMVGLMVTGVGTSRADVICVDNGLPSCVINNGLAPLEPENVIDDSTYYEAGVNVRNVGCPPGWPSGGSNDPCPSPGGPTEVEVVGSGETEVRALQVLDSSTLVVRGGISTFWKPGTPPTSR